jgi:Tfp pilus assembly protein PilF
MKEENVKPEMGESVEVNFKLTPGPDRKFPFEMSDEERKAFLEEYEAREQARKFSAAVKKRFDKGVELFDNKQFEEAAVEFTEALKLDSKQPAVHSRLGDSYKNIGKYEEALASYEKSLELDPINASVYTNKGEILNKLGREKESLEAFQKATELSPGGGGALSLCNIGITHLNNGNLEEAESFFRKAIESDSSYAEAYYLLATCLSSNMDTVPESLDYFRQYIELGSNSENVEAAKQIIEALKDYAK